jgi:hypothetical protein
MKLGSRKTWLFAAVAFLAALAGVFIGRSLSEHRTSEPSALHELLHEELKLDERQLAQIEELEARFAIRRRSLELELRTDNARLAAAIQAEHGYGPRVTSEIDRSHQAMGQLQKETLSHIFAMRAVLRQDQAEKFDLAIVKALTADAR